MHLANLLSDDMNSMIAAKATRLYELHKPTRYADTRIMCTLSRSVLGYVAVSLFHQRRCKCDLTVAHRRSVRVRVTADVILRS